MSSSFGLNLILGAQLGVFNIGLKYNNIFPRIKAHLNEYTEDASTVDKFTIIYMYSINLGVTFEI